LVGRRGKMKMNWLHMFPWGVPLAPRPMFQKPLSVTKTVGAGLIKNQEN
jgi:hypothetical protein